jgi:hypothetical protein
VWLVPLAPSVATYILNWFFFPKSGFLGIYLNLQRQKSFKNQYLHTILNPNLTK